MRQNSTKKIRTRAHAHIFSLVPVTVWRREWADQQPCFPAIAHSEEHTACTSWCFAMNVKKREKRRKGVVSPSATGRSGPSIRDYSRRLHWFRGNDKWNQEDMAGLGSVGCSGRWERSRTPCRMFPFNLTLNNSFKKIIHLIPHRRITMLELMLYNYCVCYIQQDIISCAQLMVMKTSHCIKQGLLKRDLKQTYIYHRAISQPILILCFIP